MMQISISLNQLETMQMMGQVAEQVEMDYPETLNSLFGAQLVENFLTTW